MTGHLMSIATELRLLFHANSSFCRALADEAFISETHPYFLYMSEMIRFGAFRFAFGRNIIARHKKRLEPPARNGWENRQPISPLSSRYTCIKEMP